MSDDTAAYLEELAATLASHGSNLAALRREALEQKVSPYLPTSATFGAGPATPRVGSNPVANTLGNVESFIGQTNLLRDPAWENWGGATVTTGTTATAISSYWKCHHVLNSGTIPATHGFYGGYYVRGNSPFNSEQVAFEVGGFGTNACDLDVYLYPSTGHAPATFGPQEPPYLVAGVLYSHQDLTFGDATVSITLQIVDDTPTVVYESPALDPTPLAWGNVRRLLAYTQQTTAEFIAHVWTWRLRIHVVKPATTTTYITLTFGEPLLHFAYSPGALAYAPVVASWVPTSVSLESDSVNSYLVYSKASRTAHVRFGVKGDGNTTWGGGAASADTRLYRPAAKTLTIDDGADGAATLKVIGTRLAPPSASQTLAAGTALLANAEFVMFTCTGAVTSTAAPTIANGLDGQMLTVLNVGTGTWTISDQGTLASSNLRLTAATVAIAPRNSIQLVYSATVGDWVQVGALTTVI